jgi:hypothetical protein
MMIPHDLGQKLQTFDLTLHESKSTAHSPIAAPTATRVTNMAACKRLCIALVLFLALVTGEEAICIII